VPHSSVYTYVLVTFLRHLASRFFILSVFFYRHSVVMYMCMYVCMWNKDSTCGYVMILATRLYALHSLYNRFTHTLCVCTTTTSVVLWRTFTILLIQSSIVLNMPTYTFPELTRRPSEVIIHAFNKLTVIRRFLNFFLIFSGSLCMCLCENEWMNLFI
jgi:hypothetical protein